MLSNLYSHRKTIKLKYKSIGMSVKILNSNIINNKLHKNIFQEYKLQNKSISKSICNTYKI